MIKPRHNQTCNPVPSDALSGRCVPSPQSPAISSRHYRLTPGHIKNSTHKGIGYWGIVH
ncbi:MAG: hypothetical protein ACFKPT_18480 [Gloeotrichia echinulata GP01]